MKYRKPLRGSTVLEPGFRSTLLFYKPRFSDFKTVVWSEKAQNLLKLENLKVKRLKPENSDFKTYQKLKINFNKN